MNSFKHLLATSALLITSSAFATITTPVSTLDKDASLKVEKENKVAINWVKPTSYRDVRDPSKSRKRFREQVLAEFQDFFNELSEELPEGTTLSLEVTNIDLAGTLQVPSQIAMAGTTGVSRGVNELRIMRDVDIPRFNFSYTLTDAQGKVVKTDEVKLKDMSYLRSASIKRRNEALRYEKNMIEKWFKRTFTEQS